MLTHELRELARIALGLGNWKGLGLVNGLVEGGVGVGLGWDVLVIEVVCNRIGLLMLWLL